MVIDMFTKMDQFTTCMWLLSAQETVKLFLIYVLHYRYDHWAQFTSFFFEIFLPVFSYANSFIIHQPPEDRDRDKKIGRQREPTQPFTNIYTAMSCINGSIGWTLCPEFAYNNPLHATTYPDSL